MNENEKLSESLYDDVPPPPAAPTSSRWEDFIDIFYAPSQVFARRMGTGFIIPMLVVAVLVGLIYVAASGVMQPIMDAEFSRSMAAVAKKNPSLTPEQLEAGRAIQEKIGKVVIFIITPIVMLIVGVVLWLVGKLVDAKQTVGDAIMVASYAYFPKVVESLINSVQAMMMDPASLNGRYRLSLGLGRFLDPDTASPLLLGVLGRIDVFTIWVTILLAIGLSVTGKVSKQKAAIAGVIMWLVGAIPALLGALQAR